MNLSNSQLNLYLAILAAAMMKGILNILLSIFMAVRGKYQVNGPYSVMEKNLGGIILKWMMVNLLE